jgi:hypothetical protein
MVKKINLLLFSVIFGPLFMGNIESVFAQDNSQSQTRNHSGTTMLIGDWVPENSSDIDFFSLPKLRVVHSTVTDSRDFGGTRVNQHNYLINYQGLFFAMWSDGPGVTRAEPDKHRDVVPGHDLPGQIVSFSVSKDGLEWTDHKNLTGDPKPGYGWIARGFWHYNGRLIALVSQFEGRGYAGYGLELHAYELSSIDDLTWNHLGMIQDNSMNNFPPKKLPTGEWMMSRRDSLRDVHMLIGGVNDISEWINIPKVNYEDESLAAEEPYWWILPDNSILALFRDNKRSGFLYRSFSYDNGRTWSKPEITNYPDATSKFSGIRLLDGRYVLVSNSNPKKRDPLTISVSYDGIRFHNLGFLVGYRHIDYPHIIEHEGYLYIAFASAKQTVEVIRVNLSELDFTMP